MVYEEETVKVFWFNYVESDPHISANVKKAPAEQYTVSLEANGDLVGCIDSHSVCFAERYKPTKVKEAKETLLNLMKARYLNS